VRLRQEQIVLIASLALLAWLFHGTMKDPGTGPRSQRGGSPPELEHHPAPDVARALPADGRDPARLSRHLFEPPRDTRPLPPLGLEPPPLEPLPGLRPPAGAGPAPRLFGRLLRADVTPTLVTGLFDEVEPGGEGEGEGLERQELDEPPLRWSELSPDERMERIAGYKRLYDWIKIADLKWGRITNRDRYRLAKRPSEAVLFVEFDPLTGLERFPGQQAIAYPRERVEELGFADTIANRIELERLTFGDVLTPGQLGPALAFADWCVEERLETPRALEVAEEFYTRARAIANEDPSPDLGLARCYEAGFQFERAFQVYERLIAGRFAQNGVVLARLAQLEARLRMFARAERRLEQAERFDRSSWEVQWAVGRFLLERGRPQDAVEHLQLANRLEPTAAEHKGVRAAIRADLGNALLASGDTGGALSGYGKSLQADPAEQRGMAGILSASYLSATGVNGGAPTLAGTEVEGAGFDLLLATGLLALGNGEWSAAKEKLELAAQSDPLRACQAWRALSWLAEISAFPEEALRFAELAEQNDPTDVYTLIQLGRVLAARDDVEGALDAFTRALDRELDLPDVLAAMGELSYRSGAWADAERYLERSITLEPSVADVHVLRGLNLLQLGRAAEAQPSFERALEIERLHPVAKNGLAWCAYARGDSVEAMTVFRELDDARRELSEDDLHRVYARHQIERITDHEEKVVWTDRFERNELKNEWMIEESQRVSIDLIDGAVWIEGDFPASGRARVKRQYPAGDFVSLEARLTIHEGTRVRCGLFVSMERVNRGEFEVKSEVTLSRHHDKTTQTRVLRTGQGDPPYVDVPIIDWPDEIPKVLRIERYGESAETRFRLLVDGIPVAQDLPGQGLGSSTGILWVGVYAEGEPGRRVRLEIDDVEVVKRERR